MVFQAGDGLKAEAIAAAVLARSHRSRLAPPLCGERVWTDC